MSSLHITYAPRLDIACESEPVVLSAIYRRAIERYEEQKKGGPATAPNDAMKGSSDDRATEQYRG